MKRTVIACLLILVGLIGLFSEVTIYDGKYHRVTQSLFGGKLTVKNYDSLKSGIRPDLILNGVKGADMEEIIDKVLSDDISLNALHNLADSPHICFKGMERLYVPKLPDGCALKSTGLNGSIPVGWRAKECTFQFDGSFRGEITYCDGITCDLCPHSNLLYLKDAMGLGNKSSSVRYYKVGKLKVRESSQPAAGAPSYIVWGAENGTSFHVFIYGTSESDVTNEVISQFGMVRYEPEDPRVQVNPWMYVVWWGAVVMIISGTALLIFPLFQRKKKAPATNT